MRPFGIPVVSLGPGSQPAGDKELQYVALPPMETFALPRLPETVDPRHAAAAAQFVDHLVEAMALHRPGDAAHPCLELGHLDPAVVELLNEALGQGEVSAVVGGQAPGSRTRVRIQETAFAGVWRVRHYGEGGDLCADRIEACDIPGAIRDAAQQTRPGFEIGEPPPGAMNAPAVLRELQYRLRQVPPGAQAQTINLTLLPQTPEDLAMLAQHLGVGPVTILSRGFGNCRIASTAVRGLWRVQYFNAMETLILDTIEVVDLPEVALAAAEDFADSIERLGELLDWMRNERQR